MSTLTPVLLRTEQLAIAVGERILCEQLNLAFTAGQFWCVLGRNGIGKTTLLHTLAGLWEPAAGSVFIQGHEMRLVKPQQLARWRGLLLQQQSDAFSSSVLATVMTGRYPYQLGWSRDSAEDYRLVIQALKQVEMLDYRQSDVLQLSGGERQRVALATLLVQDPCVLLLDEPTAHQDVAAQMRVMQLLSQQSKQKVVIAACHDINLVARYATHVLLLGQSQVWQGCVDQVLQPQYLQLAFGCPFDVIISGGQRVFMPTTM